MCGICGFLFPAGLETPEAVAQGMAGRLRHRGPDGRGVWVDPAAGVAFGHTRLAIRDLSAAGSQPMHSADGRWTLTYNGEIYNAAEIGADLAAGGVRFRGHSDTEVLLEAVAAWGPEAALRRANGMLALALWDHRDRRLILARDRIGKKPLYYGLQGGHLLFGSELKALRAHPAFAAPVDRDVVAAFLRLGWVSGSRSIHRGILTLPPGTMLTLSPGMTDLPAPQPFWSALDTAEALARDPLPGSLDEATDALEALLLDAVERRMIADVPLGALLSGGVDSALVVALMRKLGRRPVRTFTIGFSEPRWDEAPAARAFASHLGTEHAELYVSPGDARAVIPQLPEIWDEPFADPSQLPTTLVCRLARGSVAVALSGDGGDEPFGGYGRYRRALARWAGLHGWPLQARRALAGLAARGVLGTRLQRRLRGIDAGGPLDLYVLERSRSDDPAALVPGSVPTADRLDMQAAWPRGVDPAQVMLYLDLAGYLPDNNLVKVDRASMAVGLEVRSPLLDHRVVEMAFRMPLAHRLAPDRGKLVLAKVLERHVPKALFDRPKRGFGLPIGPWLRGPLRDWAEDLLDGARLRREGMLDAARVRTIWQDHVDGRRDAPELLWHLLMFQAWQAHWGGANPSP